MAQPLEILKQYWNFSQFRPLQEEIIQSVINGHDTLALLPTGGGKSICYQVPGLMQDGICIVVSPLIALMKDQLEGLKKKGIKATIAYSGLTKREIDIALDNCVYGGYKFLFLSPERLETDIFRERVQKMNVNLLAVDEAHCISEWGYDFRPAYLKIAEIRPLVPKPPVLGLTATATETVKKDIREKLGFNENAQTFQKSFDRPNLVYGVAYQEDKRRKLLDILNKVKGTGIIYVRTRKATREIATFLQQNNIRADYYNGGLDHEERNNKQAAWMRNQTRIMVATNAFGMGIDKPDVRMVIHLNLPDTLEAYYQEAGRAGRDEKKAYAVALVYETDRHDIHERLDTTFPSLDEIRNVYHALGSYFQIPVGAGCNQSYDFDIKDFSRHYNLPPFKVHNALKILEQEGYMATTDSVFTPSRLMVRMDYNDLYKFQVENRVYDPLLKGILRSYEGIFDQYVKINENDLTTMSGLSVKKIHQQLKQLKKLEVLDHAPKKNEPQITYLTERLDRGRLHLDHEHINYRKHIFEQKLNAVLKYAFEYQGCKSKYLLNYFGETLEQDCGHCDYCIRKNTEVKEPDFDAIKQQILKNLKNANLSFDEMKRHIKGASEEHVLEVLRWLHDHDQVVYKDQKIALK